MRSTLPLLALLLTLGCKDKAAPEDDTGSPVDSGETGDVDLARAEALWTSIDGFETWGQVADWEGRVASADGTHGDFVEIWLDPSAQATIEAAAGGVMPDGAIIVKGGFTAEGDTAPKGITVMEKDSTYGETGWFWVNYQPDGTPAAFGETGACVSCHESGQDYVRFTTW